MEAQIQSSEHTHEHLEHIHEHPEHVYEHNEHAHEHNEPHGHNKPHAHNELHECHDPHHGHNELHECHDHHHGHAAEAPTSKEERLALLAYMVSHNKHHAEELAELAKGTTGAAAECLQKAIASFDAGNAQLEIALKLLKED